MKQFKPSFYNIMTPYENDLLIFNTKTGKRARVSLVHADAVSNGNGLSKDMFTSLMDLGLWVPEDLDEGQQVDEMGRLAYEQKDQLELTILPTEQCNFRCKYCYETFDKKAMTVNVQDAIIRYVENNIHKYKHLSVSWFGGEPLIAVPVIERLSEAFIAICRKNGVVYTSGMTTNGYFLTPEMLRVLKKLHVLHYQITIDGLEATHNAQRVGAKGQPTWQTIIDNLRSVKAQVKSGICHYMIRINLTQPIYQLREELIAFFKENFGDDARFSIFWFLASDWGNMQDASISSQFCTLKELEECEWLSAKAGIKAPLSLDSLMPNGSVCYACKDNAFVIGSDGDIKKCTLALEDPENRLGNIEEKDDVFYSSRWDSRPKVNVEHCSQCKFRPICHNISCMHSNQEYSCAISHDQFTHHMKCLAQIGYEYKSIEM